MKRLRRWRRLLRALAVYARLVYRADAVWGVDVVTGGPAGTWERIRNHPVLGIEAARFDADMDVLFGKDVA